jgi:hypothetical protein
MGDTSDEPAVARSGNRRNRGIALTVETEDFDRGAFSFRGSLDIRTEKSTVQIHAAITELCRSVTHRHEARRKP